LASNQQALIFIHIPKSAGTTLNHIIVWEYSPFHIASVDGRFPRWAFRHMTRWSPRRLARNDVFTGHMPFGLDKLMARESTYVTILRKPVERVISEYFYRIGRKSHPLEDRKIKGFSLRDYVEKLPYDNVQTKLLAGGSPGYDFMAGDCSAAMLETAKRNLAQRFRLVGLTERFEETLALFKIVFGWKVRRYATLRVTPVKAREKDVPGDLRELIAERNRFDVALYQHGVELFEQTLAQHRERMPQVLDEVRKARLPEGAASRRYGMISFLRRFIIRPRSDL
jgi:Galactose-3-O-sulfotransferase